MVNKILFSSKSNEWSTPQDLFNRLDKIFHFELDVCANENNKKCEKYFDKEINGLEQAWDQVNWMNPPYSRLIKFWIDKAYKEYLKGKTIVCLVPSRTDTQWFQYCFKAKHIIFIKGRLKFSNSKSSAPFPSCLAIFTDRTYDLDPLRDLGKIIKLK